MGKLYDNHRISIHIYDNPYMMPYSKKRAPFWERRLPIFRRRLYVHSRFYCTTNERAEKFKNLLQSLGRYDKVKVHKHTVYVSRRLQKE